MTNSLTGDYDVVLEVSLDALNRILAALHEVGSEPHSFTWKIPRTSVDFPSGLAEVQVSTPTVKIQEQWQGYDFAPYTNRITAHQRIMIYYIPDPHSPPMPEFIHGDLEITVNVAVKSLSYGSGLDKMFRKVLNVDLSSNNVLVSFKPIWTSSPLDQKQTNWLIKYITEFLATKINPINVPLPPSFQNLKNVEVDFNEAEPGNIWDSWYDYSGGWHKQKINTPNNSIRAPFAAGDVFVSVYNPGTGNDSQQHFVYVDKNGSGKIWDVWYDYGGGWHLQQINAGSNSSVTSSPPSIGNVFVSAYNPGGGDSQQHFAYRELPSGFGVVLVSILPNSPSNPYPGSVTADLVGGNDFALAASSGYIAHLIQNQKLTLSDFQINFNWSIGPVSGTITYNIHVNSVTVGLSSGHVTLTVTGHAHTNSNIAGVGFPDTDFTITQNVSLAISGGTVVLSALGDPSISLSGILGSIQGAFNGQLVNSIKPKRDQLLQQVQTSFQSMLKTQTQSIIQSINKSLKVSPQITYSGVTVDADGIVLFGSIGFKDRVPVHAEFTQRNAANQPGQIELNALASWVPGGTIGNEPPGEVAFVWSLKRDSNDTKPTVITELHKFVTRFKNDIPASYICLTVYGTRVTGETVSGEHCQ